MLGVDASGLVARMQKVGIACQLDPVGALVRHPVCSERRAFDSVHAPVAVLVEPPAPDVAAVRVHFAADDVETVSGRSVRRDAATDLGWPDISMQTEAHRVHVAVLPVPGSVAALYGARVDQPTV